MKEYHTLLIRFIISQPDNVLNAVYQYIFNCENLPDEYDEFNHYKVKHAVILFFRKYNADKVSIRLGFDPDDLETLNITQEELEENFDYYVDLSYNGRIIQINGSEKGKDVALIAADVAFALGLGEKV